MSSVEGGFSISAETTGTISCSSVLAISLGCSASVASLGVSSVSVRVILEDGGMLDIKLCLLCKVISNKHLS